MGADAALRITIIGRHGRSTGTSAGTSAGTRLPYRTVNAPLLPHKFFFSFRKRYFFFVIFWVIPRPWSPAGVFFGLNLTYAVFNFFIPLKFYIDTEFLFKLLWTISKHMETLFWCPSRVTCPLSFAGDFIEFLPTFPPGIYALYENYSK